MFLLQSVNRNGTLTEYLQNKCYISEIIQTEPRRVDTTYPGHIEPHLCKKKLFQENKKNPSITELLLPL